MQQLGDVPIGRRLYRLTRLRISRSLVSLVVRPGVHPLRHDKNQGVSWGESWGESKIENVRHGKLCGE